ncbi:hypothetical protein HY502_01860 [Candidatus Woesebacteria bacterium]|nr:hypothetical protein [Candidatus Woesebacteria bacterium]
MSESLTPLPEELSYRKRISGSELEFKVTNLCDPGLAEEQGLERGYHIELYPVIQETVDSQIERSFFIGAIMHHLTEQIFEKELAKNDDRSYQEIEEAIGLEIFSDIFDKDRNVLALIIKRVPEDFAREVNKKKFANFKKESLNEQILEQEKRIDPMKARLN